MTVMELIEELKKYEPTTVVTIAKDDVRFGWHYKPIEETITTIVRMTEMRIVGMKPASKLMSCSIEKPNAFKVVVLR